MERKEGAHQEGSNSAGEGSEAGEWSLSAMPGRLGRAGAWGAWQPHATHVGLCLSEL